MRYLSLLCTMLVMILVGCNTNPPVSLDEKSGYVKVTSNVEGAKVHLNGKDTKKLTPATIISPAGNHTIKLTKDGYQPAEKQVVVNSEKTTDLEITLSKTDVNPPVAAKKIVLLEDFANVSCDPCVPANEILHKLSSEYSGKIAIIKFPANFPAENDPLYLDAKEYSDSRMKYYNIYAVPTVFVDGITSPVSSDVNSVKNAIDQQLAKTPLFDISLEKTIKGSVIEVSSEIKLISDQNIPLENIVIHTIVMEEEISFTTPPGTNGEKTFYDVVRKMVPGIEGQKLALKNKIQKVNFSIDIQSKWNTSKLKIVMFLQNKITKEVFQAGIH